MEHPLTHPALPVVALAGNPNVGKSTLFNALTGLHQHTGNWAGKTVTNAVGTVHDRGNAYFLVDLPGCYSLRSGAAEEETARDYLCFQQPDAVIVVCDACCLERNLPLALQCMELSSRVIVCVNLLDEARKKGISVDLDALQNLLCVPVIGITARTGRGIDQLLHQLADTLRMPPQSPPPLPYGETADAFLTAVLPHFEGVYEGIAPRWAAMRFFEEDAAITEKLLRLGTPDHMDDIRSQLETLHASGITPELRADTIVTAITDHAAHIASVVCQQGHGYSRRDEILDRILLQRKFAVPLMLLLLALLLWITIIGANFLSDALAVPLFWFGDRLSDALAACHAPAWVDGLFVQGMYRVLAWVVSVMLPPMAIFFPLFTILEDMGLLPRIAFHLDEPFRRAGTCGKQALTMCMGFGCNAAGVTGCRIIQSPKERLIAAITNVFVPCNGRFPLLIALISLFFTVENPLLDSLLGAVLLLALLLFAVGMTLAVSFLLSKTLLRGQQSAFLLELPPYRKPQFGSIFVRSLLDRTVFVLGRACLAAAPAGMLLWILANFHVDGASLIFHIAHFLDPFARCLGLDGTILMGFLLGFPANEIVLPVILMGYSSAAVLTEAGELSTIHALLVENGWTWQTALSTMLFSLLHFPCATTCQTLLKETKSLKWTFLGILLPTLCGILVCAAVHGILTLIG